MKNLELYGLHAALNEAAEVPASSKFNYALNKNRHAIESYLKHLDKRVPHPDSPKFDEKRIELCEKYCTKDEDGNPIFEKNKYTGLRDNDEFNAEMDALKVEFANVITHAEGVNKIYDKSRD